MLYFDELGSPTNVCGSSDFPAMSSEVAPQILQVDSSVNSGVANAGGHPAGWIISLIVLGCALFVAATAVIFFVVMRNPDDRLPDKIENKQSGVQPFDDDGSLLSQILISDNSRFTAILHYIKNEDTINSLTVGNFIGLSGILDGALDSNNVILPEYIQNQEDVKKQIANALNGFNQILINAGRDGSKSMTSEANQVIKTINSIEIINSLATKKISMK